MLVDQDECWFSRFAQPQMHAFATAEDNLRLVQREPEKGESDKAIACYGAVCDQTKERFFCFADGQPNSEKSIAFLSTLLAVAKARCQRVLVIIWDRATWHLSKKLIRWVRQHNRQAGGPGCPLANLFVTNQESLVEPDGTDLAACQTESG